MVGAQDGDGLSELLHDHLYTNLFVANPVHDGLRFYGEPGRWWLVLFLKSMLFLLRASAFSCFCSSLTLSHVSLCACALSQISQPCFAADFFTAAVWCVPFSGAVGLFNKLQTQKKGFSHALEPARNPPCRTRCRRGRG